MQHRGSKTSVIQILFFVILFWSFSVQAAPGDLDTDFGGDGIAINDINGGDDYGYASVVDSSGRTIVAGYLTGTSNRDFVVARYTSAGILDRTFSTDGIVITPIGSSNDYAYVVAVDSRGRIIVAGTSYGSSSTGYNFAVARYL